MQWIDINDDSRRIKKDEISILLIDDNICIGFFDGNNYQVDYWISGNNGKIIFDSYNDVLKYIQKNITKWMPLPENPKDI